MPPPLQCSSLLRSTACTKQLCRTVQTSRSFSTTPRNDQRVTRARRRLFTWLNTSGAVFKDPLPGSTNYLSAYKDGKLLRAAGGAKSADAGNDPPQSTASNREEASGGDGTTGQTKAANIPPETRGDLSPFPLNRQFISQRILSTEFQEHIWNLVIKEGMSVREVSASVGVEMSRVAAVVRLFEIEEEWKRINKPLAQRYHDAIQNMLPKSDIPPPPSSSSRRTTPHESINDLPVHVATGPQIFFPTAESRHFTRADAAKVFDEKLLPADSRVPHPELAVMHKETLEGLSDEERQQRAEAREAVTERKRNAALARQAIKEASIKKVDIGRYEYRFTEIKVDDAGKDGRGAKGVGWRYGAPLMDRSRGQHKIPQAVE